MTDLHLNLDPLCWDDASDNNDDELRPVRRARLHYRGGVTICGVQFHVTAIRVSDVANEQHDWVEQTPDADRWAEEDYEALEVLTGNDTGHQTIDIGGSEYVLYLVPHTR